MGYGFEDQGKSTTVFLPEKEIGFRLHADSPDLRSLIRFVKKQSIHLAGEWLKWFSDFFAGV